MLRPSLCPLYRGLFYGYDIFILDSVVDIISRAEAKEQGLKWYFNGKPCPKGHVAERLTSNGGCRTCAKESFDSWYAKKYQEHHEYAKKRDFLLDKARLEGLVIYLSNRPCKKGHGNERYTRNNLCVTCCRDNKGMEEWRERNKEYEREYRIKRYQENREYFIEQALLYREANPEKVRERSRKYRAENPAKVKKLEIERKRALANRIPSWSDLSKINEIYKECARRSKEEGKPYHVDHLIPLRGKKVSGLHVHYNLRIIEASENCKKSNKFDESLLDEYPVQPLP